jgi:hypothetical protein
MHTGFPQNSRKGFAEFGSAFRLCETDTFAAHEASSQNRANLK